MLRLKFLQLADVRPIDATCVLSTHMGQYLTFRKTGLRGAKGSFVREAQEWVEIQFVKSDLESDYWKIK